MRFRIPHSIFQILNSKDGFTLLELLITSAIIVILSAVGVANFFGYRSQNRLNLARDQVTSLLRTVQNRAISGEEQSSWGVYFKNDAANNKYYYEVFYGGSYPGTVVATTTLDSSLKFSQPTDGDSTTTLFAQLTGTLTNSSPVDIVVALKHNLLSTTTIRVYPNGRVEN